MEGLGCINDAWSRLTIRVRSTIVIRYIECVLASVGGSRTQYPCIASCTEWQPVIAGLEVVGISTTYLNRELEGMEGSLDSCTQAGTAVATEIEDIVGVIRQTALDSY